MIRHHQIESTPPAPTGSWEEIRRVVNGDAVVTLTDDYPYIGFWVVGGGASGRSEFSNAHNAGNGGNGGQAIAFGLDYSLIYPSGTQFVITAGYGGAATATGTNRASNPGQESKVVLYSNSTTICSAAGGLAAASYYQPGHDDAINTKVEYSGRGGAHCGHGDPATYYYKADSDHPRGVMGEDGLTNPFDPTDLNKYGAGGGAGFDSYDRWSTYGSTYPNGFVGGTTGGGGGGYGADNNALNRGGDATFYGGGGGGGAFSSSHTYGAGGAGAGGIVIMYGYVNS